jgi:hypothetical protein
MQAIIVSQGTANQSDWHAVSQSSAKLYTDSPQGHQMSAKAEEKQSIQRCLNMDGKDCSERTKRVAANVQTE